MLPEHLLTAGSGVSNISDLQTSYHLIPEGEVLPFIYGEIEARSMQGGNGRWPSSVYVYGTSVPSLCDSKGLPSDLLVKCSESSFPEAVWMSQSLWGVPGWPVPGPENLRLWAPLCLFQFGKYLLVQNNHLLLLFSLGKAYLQSSKSVMCVFWHSEKKKKKKNTFQSNIRFYLHWHACGWSPPWRPAEVVCGKWVHQGS